MLFLHLLVLLDLRSSPTVLSTRLLVRQSIASVTPINNTLLKSTLGGGVGIRTRVLPAFGFASYSNKDIYYIQCRNLCQVILLGFD